VFSLGNCEHSKTEKVWFLSLDVHLALPYIIQVHMVKTTSHSCLKFFSKITLTERNCRHTEKEKKKKKLSEYTNLPFLDRSSSLKINISKKFYGNMIH
jgi:hypothetical protein